MGDHAVIHLLSQTLQHWNKLPGDVVGTLALETLEIRLDETLSNLV